MAKNVGVKQERRKQERKSADQVEQFFQMVLDISRGCSRERLQGLIGMGDALKALALDPSMILLLRRGFRLCEVQYGVRAEMFFRNRWGVGLEERHRLVSHGLYKVTRYFRFLDCGCGPVEEARAKIESLGFRPVTLCELFSFLDDLLSSPLSSPITLRVLDIRFTSELGRADLELVIDGSHIIFRNSRGDGNQYGTPWLCVLSNPLMG